MNAPTATAPRFGGVSPDALASALQYRNDRVVRRLMSEHGFSREEAEQLFLDTLKFMALAVAQNKRLSPSGPIDLGWHNFILHTRDYAEFCKSFLGRFLHHEPGVGLIFEGEQLDVEQTRELAIEMFGSASDNWTGGRRGATCGSMGC